MNAEVRRAALLFAFSRTRRLAVALSALLAGAPLAFAQPAGYVGASVCATCHSRIAETYRQSGMGRSFYRATPATADFKEPKPYYHAASDTYFQMIQRNGRLFQLQYQIGFDGRRTKELEKQVDYVIGSGNHARTYLHRTAGNTLLELPLSWYAEGRGSWSMSPGYDRADHEGFRRKIGYDCMFCHNAYPEIAPGSVEPVFSRLPEGIDCQRCHGPGENHVRAARAGNTTSQIRSTIVNPARLGPEREMEVCLQCHLETTSSPLPNAIVRFERPAFSYRPGEPLADFVLHFDRTGSPDDRFEIAGAAYRLRQSACFEKSKGTLRCTTCHDPHTQETPAQDYTAVCRQCHGAALDRLTASRKHPSGADCTGCHMPKRRTDDVVHVVMTDHYIQRRKPTRQLVAPASERPREPYRGQVVLYYPPVLPKIEDELYLAIAQVRQGSNVDAGIARLSAALERFRPQQPDYYRELGDALRVSGRLSQAVPIYQEALRRDPAGLPVLQGLALSLLSSRQPARAAEVLQRVPQDAAGWNLLGAAYVAQRKTVEAMAAFRRAVELDPGRPESYNSLGALLLETGDRAAAEPALREAVRLQPWYPEARANLANLLSAENRFDEARFQFEAALRARSGDPQTRYDYALALARVRRFADASELLETALRQQPDFAEAHELLGTVLAAQGQLPRAIEHYREALRIRPGFSRAHLHLGEALADTGDEADALSHLREAAVDPVTRGEAEAALNRLRQRR